MRDATFLFLKWFFSLFVLQPEELKMATQLSGPVMPIRNVSVTLNLVLRGVSQSSSPHKGAVRTSGTSRLLCFGQGRLCPFVSVLQPHVAAPAAQLLSSDAGRCCANLTHISFCVCLCVGFFSWCFLLVR